MHALADHLNLHIRIVQIVQKNRAADARCSRQQVSGSISTIVTSCPSLARCSAASQPDHAAAKDDGAMPDLNFRLREIVGQDNVSPSTPGIGGINWACAKGKDETPPDSFSGIGLA